jgi:hypothetical protein
MARQKSEPAANPSDLEWDRLTPNERFIRTARELGCEENLDRFDEAVKQVGSAKPTPQKSASDAQSEAAASAEAGEKDRAASRKAVEGSRAKRRRGRASDRGTPD